MGATVKVITLREPHVFAEAKPTAVAAVFNYELLQRRSSLVVDAGHSDEKFSLLWQYDAFVQESDDSLC
jgi:hypothetical protein